MEKRQLSLRKETVQKEKDMPLQCRPYTMPPFFKYMLAKTPERRKELVEQVKKKNNQRKEECRRMDIDERIVGAKIGDIGKGNIKVMGTMIFSGLSISMATCMVGTPLGGMLVILGIAGTMAALVIGVKHIIKTHSIAEKCEKMRNERGTIAPFNAEWYNLRMEQVFEEAERVIDNWAEQIDEWLERK